MNIIPIILILLLAFSGCSSVQEEQNTVAYKQISQEEVKEMMGRNDGHVIVDVRRQDEYDAGHIPGAILIPNESIGSEAPETLPDYEQIILIYCRTGNRSRQASEKLAAMGYKNIYEFGGINGLMSESTILWFGIMLVSTDTAYRVCYPALKKNFFNWRRNRSAIGVKV